MRAFALALFLLAATAGAEPARFTLVPGAGPVRHAGTSGGAVAARTADVACRGYITREPSCVLALPHGLPFLRAFVESPTDATLVVRGPDGRFACADDTYGTHPGLDAAYGPGVYYLWVGSFAPTARAPYVLTLTTERAQRPPVTAPSRDLAAAGLDPRAAPVYGPLDLASLASAPVRAQGVSGGPVRAQTLGDPCRGALSAAPSHTFVLATAVPFLRIAVRAQGDSTLVLARPDGTVGCADDTYGVHPEIEGPFAAGRYALWVGSYAPGRGTRYELTLSRSAERARTVRARRGR